VTPQKHRKNHSIPFYIGIVSLVLFLAFPAHAQEDPTSELILLVNQFRDTYGLPPLQIDPYLTFVAQTQAETLAASRSLNTLGTEGNPPDYRAVIAGYGSGNSISVAENIAIGPVERNSPEQVVAQWQQDYGYLDAMISEDYQHIGVGYVEVDGMSWFVMTVGWIGEENLQENQEGDDKSEREDIQATEVSVIFNPPFVISTPDQSGAIYHEVQPGQSAWTIAVYYKINLPDLLTLNNLSEDSFIHPGDLLLIRAGQPPTATPSPTTRPTRTLLPTEILAGPLSSKTATLPSRATNTPTLALDAPERTVPTRMVLLLGIGGGMVMMTVLIIRLRPQDPKNHK
jgi:uncharacterized protein YkwD/LysM repeat protein